MISQQSEQYYAWKRPLVSVPSATTIAHARCYRRGLGRGFAQGLFRRLCIGAVILDRENDVLMAADRAAADFRDFVLVAGLHGRAPGTAECRAGHEPTAQLDIRIRTACRAV